MLRCKNNGRTWIILSTGLMYDYLGFAPRTYSSYNAIVVEAGTSRFYAVIHYMPGINVGLTQGRKVAGNILLKK